MSSDEDETGATEPFTPGIDRRLWVVFMAGVVIASLCFWRAVTPRVPVSTGQMPELKQPAPPFKLYDQSSELVNLDAFLHRHTIVLVFFDGTAGPESDRNLTELRRFYPALKREGIVAFGVSTALPQENRRNSSQPFPFPLLSDADAVSKQSVHRKWGTFVKPPSLDKPAGTHPGLFLIDRAGLVRWNVDTNQPIPEENTDGIVARLLNRN